MDKQERGSSVRPESNPTGNITVMVGRNSADDDRKSAGRLGPVKINIGLPSASATVRDKLRALDVNGDGTLDEGELVRGIEELLHETKLRQAYKHAAFGLLVVVLVLIGAIGGMTYGIVEATKETKVTGSVMVSNDNPNAVIQTAVYDMAVVDGVLVSRQTAGVSSNSNGSESTNKTSSAVLRAATFTTQQAFSSAVNIKALMEMKYFYVQAASGAELALVVLGVARVIQPNSVHGSVVKIVTASGTIVLDDVMISFQTELAPIFVEAGFVVDNAGRRLLGVYDIFGFFSYIEDMEVFNLPKNEPKPSLPETDFEMTLKVWEPCALTVDGEVLERCHYDPGHAVLANDTAYDNAAYDNSTTNGRHLLQGTGLTEVLPGVEVMEDGLEYMTSINTVTRVGALVRTIYQFANVPDAIKVEIMNEDTKGVVAWQVPKDTVLPGAIAYWCQNFTLPPTFFDSSPRANFSGANFSFVGYVTKMGTPARHFLLTIPQPAGPDGTPTPALSVDYYDAADSKYPLFFDFFHHKGGHMMMHVQSFKVLNATNRPSSKEMRPPTASACDISKDDDKVPRMGSPFTTPNKHISMEDTGPVGANATRRLLEDEPGVMRHTGSSGKPAYMYDPYYDPERPWMSEAYNRSFGGNRRSDLSDCAYEIKAPIPPLGPCDFGLSAVTPPGGVHLELACGGSVPPGGPIIVRGKIDANTCTKEVAGCVTISVGLPDSVSLLKKVKSSLGIQDIQLASVCAGYNWVDRLVFVRASYGGPPLYMWLFKAEVSAEFRFSTCCVWIEAVQIEAFVGIDFFFFSSYSSIGTYKFMSGYYLKGSPSLQWATRNPTITNYNNEVNVHSGFWGSWSPNSFCYNESPLGATTGRGSQAIGIQVRVESPGGDDTGLNSVRFACKDGSVAVAHDGFWGDWTGWRYCPAGSYITGAQMRVELPNGDDTAANAFYAKCSDGTILAPHSGYWGDWFPWVYCPSNTFVCGIKVRMESEQGSDSDDTAMNGASLLCCRN